MTSPEIKKEIRPEYKAIASHVLQEVPMRVEKAYNAFFRQVKAGEKPGYPRFKGRNWCGSFTYPDSAGWKLKDGVFTLSKIGTIRMIQHRPMNEKVKTCSIK